MVWVEVLMFSERRVCEGAFAVEISSRLFASALFVVFVLLVDLFWFLLEWKLERCLFPSVAGGE